MIDQEASLVVVRYPDFHTVFAPPAHNSFTYLRIAL